MLFKENFMRIKTEGCFEPIFHFNRCFFGQRLRGVMSIANSALGRKA